MEAVVDRLYSLTSPDLSLTLDSAGHLLTLEAPALGWTCLEARASRVPPAVLLWTSGGGDLPLSPLTLAPCGGLFRGLRLCGSASGLDLTLEVSLERSQGVFRLHLANRGHDTATRLRFQVLGPLDAGPAARLTYPFNSGWCVPVAALEPDELIVEHYPVHAAMQWLDLYGVDRGLYLGVHDSLPYYKAFLLGRQRGDPFLAWEFRDLALGPGEELALPPIHLALHPGDWRAGAELYRGWAQAHFADPDGPAWYSALPAWNWTGLRGQHETVPWLTCSDLPGVSARSADLGAGLVQLTAYAEHGHDTEFPDYRVGPSCGGEEALRRAVDTVHAAGRHLSIYTNGRIVDPASSLSPAQRQAWGARVAPGAEVWRETYGQVTFDIMCPGAEEWANLFTQRLAYLVQRYDVDGIYIDQVCGCTSLPCYAPGHRHARPNEAWASYRPFLRALRSLLRALKPDLFLATEGVNDALGQYFDSQQSHEDWGRRMEGKGMLLPELYRYTFPRHLLNVGCIRANEPFYLRLGHTLGSGFDLGIREFDELSPAFVRATRWALAVRRRHDSVFRQGTFHPQLPTDHEGYRANAFAHGDTVLIAGAWLPPQEPPQTIQVAAPWPFAGAPARVEIESATGAEQCRVEVHSGQVTVALPGREMALARITQGGRE